MKHLRSLFEMSNRKLTISFLLASIILIVASQQIGIADNLPGIAALWGGMICLFFAICIPGEDQEIMVFWPVSLLDAFC